MNRQDNDKPTVQIRLDVTVHGGAVRVEGGTPAAIAPPKVRFLAPIITYPLEMGIAVIPALAVLDNGRYYICAEGTIGGTGKRLVFARVFPGVVAASPQPVQSPDLVFMTVDSGTSDWTFQRVPLPATSTLGDTLTIVAWGFDGDYGYEVRHFTAQSSPYTYCYLYPPPGMSRPAIQAWSGTAARYRFTIAGCTNNSFANCGSLNGEWVLARDPGPAGELVYVAAMPTSFADPKRTGLWRLQFNRVDGFWYLECVGGADWPVGSGVCYRLHESAWAPTAVNVLHLFTCQGYCNVPPTVTLYPA